MNPVLQNILDRHSCRSFTEQPVESEKLQDLLTAAVWAPSGRNEQSWHFTLLANTEKIQALGRRRQRGGQSGWPATTFSHRLPFSSYPANATTATAFSMPARQWKMCC